MTSKHRVVFGAGGGAKRRVDGGFWQILQGGKIRKAGLRRVVPLGFCVIQLIGLGGEPIKIAAE